MTSKNCNVIAKGEVSWDSIFPKLRSRRVKDIVMFCAVLSFPHVVWVEF